MVPYGFCFVKASLTTFSLNIFSCWLSQDRSALFRNSTLLQGQYKKLAPKTCHVTHHELNWIPPHLHVRHKRFQFMQFIFYILYHLDTQTGDKDNGTNMMIIYILVAVVVCPFSLTFYFHFFVYWTTIYKGKPRNCSIVNPQLLGSQLFYHSLNI